MEQNSNNQAAAEGLAAVKAAWSERPLIDVFGFDEDDLLEQGVEPQRAQFYAIGWREGLKQRLEGHFPLNLEDAHPVLPELLLDLGPFSVFIKEVETTVVNRQLGYREFTIKHSKYTDAHLVTSLEGLLSWISVEAGIWLFSQRKYGASN
jgi:hypothetical protein